MLLSSTTSKVLITALLAVLGSSIIYHQTPLLNKAFLRRGLAMSTNTHVGASTGRAPIWFIAHGGPSTLYDRQHPAYKHWLRVAREIKESKLKAIVFISAHWQREDGPSKSVSVNVAETIPLVYDFYGFPKHYYEEIFETRNPEWLSKAVREQLSSKGYNVESVERGLDHGVWVPLLAAFGSKLDIPLIQVSLPPPTRPDQDGVDALQLGAALRPLRDQGFAIVGGGQPVHNLRDYFRYSQLGPGAKSPYAQGFVSALTQALVPPSSHPSHDEDNSTDPRRWDAAKALFLRPDYRQAHPTSEHLLPALVALGAAHPDEAGTEQIDYVDGALAWNMYRYG